MVYVFDSFREKEELRKMGDVIVDKKPRADIERVCSLLSENKYDLVIGVARSKYKSVIEPVAVNNIHGHLIDKTGPELYELFVPSPPLFPASTRPSRTFCNYSMYKVARYIRGNNLPVKFMFVHLSEKDVGCLLGIQGNCFV